MLHPAPEHRRLLDKLIREISRAENQAMEHALREAKRLGDAPPVEALREVAAHAMVMRTRFDDIVAAYKLTPSRAGLGALATLRHLVVDRVIDAERAMRAALLDLRHGVDVVRLMREVARSEEIFGMIRWCDNWLGARRTLVARVEAQLAWFATADGAGEADGAASSVSAAPHLAPPPPSRSLSAVSDDLVEMRSEPRASAERPSVVDLT